jgi:dimethylglycine dehydrogenase
VQPEHALPGTELDIQVLGESHRAVIVNDSPFDPDNSRLRG